MRTVMWLLGLALVFLTSLTISVAQGAPSQIDAALLDLGARLGRSISIGNLSNWRWEQTNFPDSALDCPTVSGAAGSVLGYKFQLTYSDVTYDYRVSADNAIVVYCGEIDPNQTTAPLDAAYSNRLCADDASDGPYMRSRIIYGVEAEVVQGYLNLRGQPSTDGQVLLQAPAGLPFPVTAGPDCVDGYVWWLVNVNGQTGYIAEAGDGAYLVKPKQPKALPSREALNSNLVRFLQEFTRVQGNFAPRHAWSTDSSYLALPGATGSESIWIYNLRQANLSPSVLEFDTGITTLEFRPDRPQILFGSSDGSLHLWQLESGEELAADELLYLNAHGGEVSALAFSADGERFVSAGPVAYTHVEVDRDFAAIVWNIPTVSQHTVLSGHDGLIRAIAFRYDGNAIASGADDRTVKFWDVSAGTSQSTVEFASPPLALEYSPDGSMVAVAYTSVGENLVIFDAETLIPVAFYPQPTISTTSLAYSPDGSMLAVGTAEGSFSIWDATTHGLLATYQTEGGVHDVSFSPDATLIALSTDRHSLALYGVPLGSG